VPDPATPTTPAPDAPEPAPTAVGDALALMLDPRRARVQARAPLDLLLSRPHGFAFVQAARLLALSLADVPDADGRSAFERIVRFRNSLSLRFEPSEIEALEAYALDTRDTRDDAPVDADADPDRSDTAPHPLAHLDRIDITLPFFGLLGNNGALPNHYTEQIARRESYQKDFAARAFLDIFTNRAATLFYRAWRKHRLPVLYEADRRQHYLPLVLAVAGFGMPGADRSHGARHRLRDESLAYFAGTLQQRPISAVQIERLVAHHFNVGCRIEQFVGHWFDLPDEACTRLGQSQAVLGSTAISGSRVWQRDLRIRLLLGPMRAERFRTLLPRAEASLALGELLRLTVGPTLEVEVRLILQREDVIGASLGDAGADSTSGPQLGWNSWLQTRPATTDRDDVVYELHDAAA
jgi:type VI secretion system protein ImpH